MNEAFNNFLETMNQPPEFLSLAEARSVDQALLSTHEKFLTRLTISSLRLLQHIATVREVAMEDLTPETIITWFEEDSKIRREEGIDKAYLKW
jgi:hypothetical protein